VGSATFFGVSVNGFADTYLVWHASSSVFIHILCLLPKLSSARRLGLDSRSCLRLFEDKRDRGNPRISLTYSLSLFCRQFTLQGMGLSRYSSHISLAPRYDISLPCFPFSPHLLNWKRRHPQCQGSRLHYHIPSAEHFRNCQDAYERY